MRRPSRPRLFGAGGGDTPQTPVRVRQEVQHRAVVPQVGFPEVRGFEHIGDDPAHPVGLGAQAKFNQEPALYVEFDQMREYDRRQSASMAQALGLGQVWEEDGGKTGSSC